MNKKYFFSGEIHRQDKKIRLGLLQVILVCLTIILTCGWSLAAGTEIEPIDKKMTNVDPDRLITILKTRRQPPDSEFLLNLLNHPDPRSRWLAAQDLGETGNTQFIPPLVLLLDDPNPEVRRKTRQALINLCANRKGLYAMYQKATVGLSPPGRLMAQAVWDDGKGRERARQYYQQASNLEPRRYWAAFHATPSGQLISLIRNPLSEDIARIASRIDQYAAAPDGSVPLDELRYAFALAVFAETVEREIARAALDSNDLKSVAELRQQAAHALSGIRKAAEKAKDVEIKLSQQEQRFMPSDFDPGLAESASLAQTRALAAHELGAVNTPEAVAALKEALATDPSPLVRVRAVDSLKRLCPADVHQPLLQAVQADQTKEVRRAALIALGCRDNDESRRIIRKYAQDPEYLESAILATAELGTADDLAFLFELADRILAITSDDSPPSISEPDAEPYIAALVQALKIITPKRPQDQLAIETYIQTLTQQKQYDTKAR